MSYRWSSHPFYVKRAQGLVNVEFILDILSSDPVKATEKYLTLVGAVIDKLEYNSESVGKEERKVPIKLKTGEIGTGLTWEQLVEKITVEEQLSQEMLVGKCRIRRVVAARKRLICEATAD